MEREALTSGTVLIVDDDDDVRQMLALVLEQRGFRCAQAKDGVEAMDYLLTHPAPTVALVDQMMPRWHGDDLVRAMRAVPKLTDVPVIVLSGTRWSQDAAPSPVEGWLMKPVDVDELVRALGRFTH